MAITIGTWVLTTATIATAAEVAASTALTIGAFSIGAAALYAGSIGLSYVARSLQGDSAPSPAGNSACIDARIFGGCLG